MNTKIRFNHFHDGNDFDHAVRGPAVYATCAALVNLDTGDVIEEAWAYCNPTDVASRKKGREIAEGRLKRLLDPGFHKNKSILKKITKHAKKNNIELPGNPVPEQKASSIAMLL